MTKPYMKDKKPNIICRWLNDEKILVNPDGQVLPCCYMGNPAYLYEATKHTDNPGGQAFAQNAVLKKYADNKEQYNLNHKTLKQILTSDWFNKDLPESWESYKIVPHMCQLFCDNEISDIVEPGVNAALNPEDAIFEKGVRHGFLNIKTKEEIKEKYEKYKHEGFTGTDEEIFEKGVRHGFWNVKTKEEIKEKYEKYKHLED